MVNVIVEICKKELKTRFGSKRVILPMVPSIGIPILAFVPQLLVYISQEEPESIYLTFLIFLVIPVMITTLVGINTFINEIRWKTIKSLLVAPVSEEEIFIGKSLACIITGLLAEALLSGIILIYLQNIDISLIMLFIGVGPLSVIFTTFIIIIGTSRFPNIADGGGVVFIPMSGLVIIFMIFFLLREFLKINLALVYVILALIIAILTCGAYFIAKQWFNRENLVLGIV
ncbi:MAG: hypothetical protein ACFFCZ_09330 [Promethearchaeota archaeon]